MRSAVGVRVPAADADPVSEVGRVGQALNHLLANVDAALTARQASETKVRRFVADASHELRNPLAAIRGYAELTRRDRDRLVPDTAHALDRIESEASRMSVLVEDLLLLARLDDRPELDLHPTDLSELVINAVSDARVAGPDHQWELDLPPEPVAARVDQHRVHQVLVNLLANARTHTPPGTLVARPRLAAAPGAGHDHGHRQRPRHPTPTSVIMSSNASPAPRSAEPVPPARERAAARVSAWPSSPPSSTRTTAPSPFQSPRRARSSPSRCPLAALDGSSSNRPSTAGVGLRLVTRARAQPRVCSSASASASPSLVANCVRYSSA